MAGYLSGLSNGVICMSTQPLASVFARTKSAWHIMANLTLLRMHEVHSSREIEAPICGDVTYKLGGQFWPSRCYAELRGDCMCCFRWLGDAEDLFEKLEPTRFQTNLKPSLLNAFSLQNVLFPGCVVYIVVNKALWRFRCRTCC